MHTRETLRTFLLLLGLAGVCLAQGRPRSYNKASGPIQLNDSVSSDVINVTYFRFDIECLDWCSERDCAAVNLMASSSGGICQLLVINDASQTPGPLGSHVARLLWSEESAAGNVWKPDDFADLLRARRLVNYTVAFRNSSTGSNGSIQHAVINVTGCYRIEASGAAGGPNTVAGKVAGKGALIAGSFNLTAGTQLSIVVGQAGGNPATSTSGSGGGGGSFAFRTADSHLLLAAGGGGGASYSYNGRSGQSGADGTDSNGVLVGKAGIGGTNGQPGSNSPSTTLANENHGGCGAGWLGKAVNPRRSSIDGDRGGGLADGWVGGITGDGNTGQGGFGGGGGGGADPGAAGAGGGFSGGGAGLGYLHAGGGGGSFCAGSGCAGTTGGNNGSDHGLVVLRLLASAATCG